jgi:tRNA-dihydrouridine synthase
MSQNHLEWLESPAAAFDSFFQTPVNKHADLIRPFKIGNLQLANNLILAPMAGVTDGSFRLLCSRLGVGYTVSELASARAIIMRNRQTISMLKFQGQTRPYAVQIFGANPEEMAEAARIVEELDICDVIDINMGCPVPKVVKTGSGSALMKTPSWRVKSLKR